MIPNSDLLKIRLFKGLSSSVLDHLTKRLVPRSFSAGTTILRQGEPTRALCFILTGKVRVVLTDSEGIRHHLVSLGEGEMFGERALLTGELRTADVLAHGAVTLAELGREDFEHLLPLYPELYANLCRLLAEHLGNWALRHRREEQEHKEILNNLVGWQFLPEFDAFPGTSAWARELNRRLAALAGESFPVLILGEHGTWKDLTARLIHHQAGTQPRPILFLDCASPPPVLSESPAAEQAGGEGLLREIAQESALFGHEPDSAIYARGTRRGYLELAEGGDLILAHIEQLSMRVQALLASYLQSGTYVRRGEKQRRNCRVRLIATGAGNLSALSTSGAFNTELWNQLQQGIICLKPLRERKNDIPGIARGLLGQANLKHGKQVRRLSQQAVNILVDYDWPLNGTELQQVIDRAVAVCKGQEITAENIFLKGLGGMETGRFNLLSLPSLARIARSPLFPGALRWVTIPAFLLLSLHTLGGPARNNPANLAVWALWWPLLLTGAALCSRSWCSYCPIGALSEKAAFWRRTTAESPDWLHRHGPSLSLTGLIVILAAEQTWQMNNLARPTGLLLTGLLLAALLTDQLLGRRAWCKHLCPLGRLVSQGARLSLVEMQSNPNICYSQCRIDECIKTRECPMGLHPTAIGGAEPCILCFSCVRNCPHHSIRLDLRSPLRALASRPARTLADALGAVALTGAALATQITPWLQAHSSALAHPALAFAAVAGLYSLLALGASAGKCWAGHFRTLGLAHLPLAFATLFHLYFSEFVHKGENLLPLSIRALALDRWFPPEHFVPELGTLRGLLPLILLAGTLLSLSLARRLGKGGTNRLGTRLHQLLLCAACALVLILP